VSYVVAGKAIPLTGEDDRPHPSVIWYHGNDILVGRRALEMLESRTVGVSGDFLRSPKSLLGTGRKHYVGGRVVRPVDAAAEVFKHLKAHADAKGLSGIDFGKAVVTIPVDMRGSGRKEVRQAALAAGIHVHQFVHEPFAALYGYAKRLSDPERLFERIRGQLVLVFDWGGGTLDLTLCERIGDMLVQVQNVGNTEIGGDRFDERLVRLVESRHMQKHGWSERKEEEAGGRARLLTRCELAKIGLSTKKEYPVFVQGLYRVSGSAADLDESVTESDLEEAVADLVNEGVNQIDRLLSSAGQDVRSIELFLPTGGMVAMPLIKNRLMRIFGPARCEFSDRSDALIADGAAWIAAEDIPLKLAKNIEFRHADQTWAPIVKSGWLLPRGRQSTDPVSVRLYCADPRNGSASIELARPKRASRVQAADPRQNYEVLPVDVRRNAAPLREAISLTLRVDIDLILHVVAIGQASQKEASTEIHELEFGLALFGKATVAEPSGAAGDGRSTERAATRIKRQVQAFVDSQRHAHADEWVDLDDAVWVDGKQMSLRRVVQQEWIDEFGRRPDSEVTVLLSCGIPCVRRRSRWLVGATRYAGHPSAPQPLPVGPIGTIVLRSNVVTSDDDLEMIPGDLVDLYYPGFTSSTRVTARQRDELRWVGHRIKALGDKGH
jgi:actin-like ATPase involved in cell morphogenesis